MPKQKVTEFCQENTLVIANTHFQQHKRRLYTWTSPDGQYRNQIDCILCSQGGIALYSKKKKKKTGTDCGSDHELLIAKFKLKLKKVGKTTRPFRYAKSLQSCLTLQPHRRQPTRLPRPWDSPGKNTGVGCHFLFQCMKMKSESEVAQLCLTLSDPMDYSPPGSSVHGIFQARVLEWGAIAFSDTIQV